MTNDTLRENPFSVQTPESIPGQAVVDLFVDAFSDFPKLQVPGHTFIHGPRGSGKSMMFRFMQPDCQVIARGHPVEELPYFGAYVPIKNMEANPVELRRFENHGGNFVFNEHLLCCYILVKLLAQFRDNPVPFNQSQLSKSGANDFLREVFAKRLEIAGWSEGGVALPVGESVSLVFETMGMTMQRVWIAARQFIRSVAMEQAAVESYQGPLCSYHDFLLPVLIGMKAALGVFPDAPLYLLLDDAGYLNEAQTKVLNSWIATRTSAIVSIKVSTQFDYKSFKTYAGQRVEAPHDFSEINISTVYTSNKEQYRKRVEEIVDRRLKKAGIEVSVMDFFPEDAKQVSEIERIDQALRDDWEKTGRGNRPRDDANRYARPNFIRSLGGTKKATSKYSYSGFDQLVHISSSVIRYFLEPASQMFSDHKASVSTGQVVKAIEPSIQNRVIRQYADKFLHLDMETHKRDADAKDNFARLENLLHAMGETFHACLLSDRGERRVFSIALSDRPDDEVRAIFDLGVQLGYLHASTIGNKKGTGRVLQYILRRRLAPCFNLDPTSFAGYLFVTNARIKQAIANPQIWLRDIERLGLDSLEDDKQLQLLQT
jgi:hypothetical protein